MLCCGGGTDAAKSLDGVREWVDGEVEGVGGNGSLASCIEVTAAAGRNPED